MTAATYRGHSLRMWPSLVSIGAMAMALTLTASHPALPSPSTCVARKVIINGTRLGDARLHRLERQYRVHIPAGRYWYDRDCGAWGLEGGPTLGFTLAGLHLGGPLRWDASRGRTRVFINGRELHWRDVDALRELIQVTPGRYWLDAEGWSGYEGGRPLVNLFQLARSAGRRRCGPWSHSTRTTDAHVGGDGQGFLFYIDRDGSWTPD